MKTDQTDAIIKDNSIEEVNQIKGKPMTFKTCKDINLHSKDTIKREKTIKSSKDHLTRNIAKVEVFKKFDDARNSANVAIQVENFSEANNTLNQNTIIEHIKSNIKQEKCKKMGKSKSRVDSYKLTNNINKKKQLEQKKKINEMYTFHSKWRSKSKSSSHYKSGSKKRETPKKIDKNRVDLYKLDKQVNKSPNNCKSISSKSRSSSKNKRERKNQQYLMNIYKDINKKHKGSLNIKQPSPNIDKASFLDRMEKGLTNEPGIFNIQYKHKEETKECAYKHMEKGKSKSGKTSRYNISHNSSRRCNN